MLKQHIVVTNLVPCQRVFVVDPHVIANNNLVLGWQWRCRPSGSGLHSRLHHLQEGSGIVLGMKHRQDLGCKFMWGRSCLSAGAVQFVGAAVGCLESE